MDTRKFWRIMLSLLFGAWGLSIILNPIVGKSDMIQDNTAIKWTLGGGLIILALIILALSFRKKLKNNIEKSGDENTTHLN